MTFDWQDLGTRVPGYGADGGFSLTDSGPNREDEIEKAYQRGLQDGEASGLERALRELDPSRKAAEQAAHQLDTLNEDLHARLEENVLALALVVARKVMEREIRSDQGHVAELVQKALAHFPLDQKIRVRLNPKDVPFISGSDPEQKKVETGGREVRWTPDESVSPGGCLVEGPEHVVDGRLDSALERIYRTVFND